MFSWFNLLFFILFKCKCHHLTDRWQSLRVNFRHYKIHHKKIRLVFFVLERKVVNVIWIHVNTLRRLVNSQVSAKDQIVFNLLAVNVLIDGISVTIYFSTKSTRIYKMCFTFAENFDKIPRPNVIHDNDTHTHPHVSQLAFCPTQRNVVHFCGFSMFTICADERLWAASTKWHYDTQMIAFFFPRPNHFLVKFYVFG